MILAQALLLLLLGCTSSLLVRKQTQFLGERVSICDIEGQKRWTERKRRLWKWGKPWPKKDLFSSSSNPKFCSLSSVALLITWWFVGVWQIQVSGLFSLTLTLTLLSSGNHTMPLVPETTTALLPCLHKVWPSWRAMWRCSKTLRR